jgi:hypothetical protein
MYHLLAPIKGLSRRAPLFTLDTAMLLDTTEERTLELLLREEELTVIDELLAISELLLTDELLTIEELLTMDELLTTETLDDTKLLLLPPTMP